MNALRRELSEGLCPLPETFTALVRLFGSKGYATRGLEILAAMEKLDFDIRNAWLVLIGTLFHPRLCNNSYFLLPLSVYLYSVRASYVISPSLP